MPGVVLTRSGKTVYRDFSRGPRLRPGKGCGESVGTITVGVIRNGSTYLAEHLRQNDYWAEGEKQVQGQWIGRAAEMRGLGGEVKEHAFEDLRENRDWRTGRRLTARMNKQRMALFDIQISAPKDVSVLAMVGGDERVREAFVESVKTALSEMEHFAAVRERRGEARHSEGYRLTGNFVGAMFVHDASRDLDPQLHVHAVLANVTWDPEQSRSMALQRAGLLGEIEVEREAVAPLQWTEEQRRHGSEYRAGDRLLFVRDTDQFRRGMAAEVAEIAADGLVVRRDSGQTVKVSWKQAGAFEVGRAERLLLSAGDRVLIRGRHDGQGWANGDVKQVARVEAGTGEVVFTDGKALPADFHAWTHGHAMTAYRSQGTTAEESFLVLGETAARTLSRRQFYVANTRYRGRHRIYVANRQAVLARLAERDPGRELASEFVERRGVRLTQLEFVSRHRLTRVMETVRLAMWTAADEWHRLKETIRQRMDF